MNRVISEKNVANTIKLLNHVPKLLKCSVKPVFSLKSQNRPHLIEFAFSCLQWV